MTYICGARPQLVVNLMETGFPSEMVFQVNTTQYAELVRLGMDEAAEFLETGAVARSADVLTICPADADVRRHVCQ